MSVVLHVGRWQLWVGWTDGRFYAGRIHDADVAFGVTVEIY